jgi:hypothetical protein
MNDTTHAANVGSAKEKQQDDYTLNSLTLATGKQANDPNLTPYTPTFTELLTRLSVPDIGTKDGGYFTRCSGTKRNNNDTSDTASILIIDGDSHINTDTGEIISGAVAPELVHAVLSDLGINHCIYSSFSNGENGADYHKYRVIIPCTYTREQFSILLKYLFEQLHSNEVMLAPVKENLTWSQAWYFPRVKDEKRFNLFEFFQLSKGENLNADAITKDWLINNPKPEPIEPPPLIPKQPINETNGRRNPIKEFNQSCCVHDVLIRNGYTHKKGAYLRPNSDSGIPATKLCLNCKDGVQRVYSHGGDVLNDGYAHDAFDCYKLLECGGDLNIALNWNEELTKHNRRIYAKEQAEQQQTNSAAGDDIDDNAPLAHDFPLFDDRHYYGIAGELSALASEDSEADRMAVYVSFLCACCALLGKEKFLRIGESKHFARLFVALVGASSRARKGTSLKPVVRIIGEAENCINFSEPLKFADGGLSSAEGLIYQVRDEAEDTDRNDNPVWSAVDDKRLLVVEEELGNVLKQCQRDGNTLSATLRRAWDGGTLAPMTKNHKLTATNPHINVLSHITQFELKCLMGKSDMNNGLANRFLWACVRRTKKLAFPLPMNDDKVKVLAEKLADAIKEAKGEGEITLSTDARAYWDVKYHEVSQDEQGILGAITSRSEAYVMRVSLLFCLLDCTPQIEQRHIEAACHLVEFCNKSAQFIFTTPAECEAGTDADKLLNALAEKSLNQTAISKLFSGHKKRPELMTLLNELQSMNKIKKLPQLAGSKTVMWAKV